MDGALVLARGAAEVLSDLRELVSCESHDLSDLRELLLQFRGHLFAELRRAVRRRFDGIDQRAAEAAALQRVEARDRGPARAAGEGDMVPRC